MSGVASPCVGRCRIDADTGWCIGCLRTLDEISQWRDSSDAQKRIIWARLSTRRQPPAPCSGVSPAQEGSLAQ